jgi:hypothetical protein
MAFPRAFLYGSQFSYVDEWNKRKDDASLLETCRPARNGCSKDSYVSPLDCCINPATKGETALSLIGYGWVFRRHYGLTETYELTPHT